ncbi:MAG: hypothetical protein LUH15_00680 [Tannerellaceae bacterium]|nr:hypothetical protein [Tannerellaceae bacterium]
MKKKDLFLQTGLALALMLAATSLNAQSARTYTYDAAGNRVVQTVENKVVGIDSGTDYTAWEYKLPERTRTATPWTQELYSDGSKGPKLYDTPSVEKETAIVTEKISTWDYSLIESTGNRTRTRQPVYTFTDIVKEGTTTTETHSTTSRTEKYAYNYANQSRTVNILFTFQDNSTYTLDKGTEKGTIQIVFTAASSTNYIVAGGGTATFSAGDPHLTWNGTRMNHPVTMSNLQLITVTPGTGFTVGTTSVTAENRGTISGDERKCVVQLKANATIDGVTTTGITSSGKTIYQYGNWPYSSGNDIVATPSSVTLNRNGGYQTVSIAGSITVKYASGATKFIYLDSSSMKATVSDSWLHVSSISTSSCTFSTNSANNGSTRYGTIYMTCLYEGTTLSGTINVTQTSN